MSATFNASPAAIVAENGYGKNFSSVVGVSVLIPVSHLPALSQISHPHIPKHHRMFFLVVIVSLGANVLVLLLIALLVYAYCLRERKKKTMNHMGSSLETSDLIQTKAQPKSEDFKEKLLLGVSGYLNQPTMYENKMIMEVTMNLSETCRIGKLVYRATINEMVLAVKKTKEDVCGEELKIQQKVNHTNLVRLVGISFDTKLVLGI